MKVGKHVAIMTEGRGARNSAEMWNECWRSTNDLNRSKFKHGKLIRNLEFISNEEAFSVDAVQNCFKIL